MSHPDRRTLKPFAAAFPLAIVALLTAAPQALCQDKGEPLWGEFLKQRPTKFFLRDRLLKHPFVDEKEEEVKGLTAKLRARELDIPNRQLAVQYLATLHCAKFPEAKKMLLDVLVKDQWEPVRYEAARALRDMFSNCACDADQEEDTFTLAKRFKKGDFRRRRGAPDAGSPKHCACCCDAETLEILSKVAYGLLENGCTFEPSRRVRQMAVEAIRACGVPCRCQPFTVQEEHGPPAWDTGDDSGGGNGGRELVPRAIEEAPAPTGDQTTGVDVTLPQVTHIQTGISLQPQPIARLAKICLVSLKQGRRVMPNRRFASSYRGRLYYFSSQTALEEFNAAPQEYAVAFGGCDPVHFVDTQQVLEGRFLVMHDNRFYMFATEENYEQFKSDVARYTGRKSNTSDLALAAPSP